MYTSDKGSNESAFPLIVYLSAYCMHTNFQGHNIHKLFSAKFLTDFF